MCKYCENARIHEKLLNTGIDGDGVYLGCSKSIMPESDKFECCPKCGAPLGEVKSLTVKQLVEYEGKPVWIKDLSQTMDVKNNHWSIKQAVKEWIKVIKDKQQRFKDEDYFYTFEQKQYDGGYIQGMIAAKIWFEKYEKRLRYKSGKDG